MAWEVVTPPSDPLLSVEEAKKQSRAVHNAEDALLERLIEAASRHIEITCNRALMPQTWKTVLHGFPRGEIPLSGGPFRDVTVKYRDPTGDEQTLSSSAFYAQLAEPAFLLPVNSWPATSPEPGAVTITADVGYADGKVPEDIRLAALLLVAHWFENREAVVIGTISSEVPLTVQTLLFPYRDGSVM